ncbi:hypothetical protein [Brevibacillus borstelensis]|uniref:hypothetical protein n=1 Tax=Brevibacillus borstelensis TaxID=45462 RepID=UPI0030F873EF
MLVELSNLIKEKNEVESKIAKIIGRPANIGHIGEYIAATIFLIQLEESATNKGSDGYFTAGELEGSTVDIKLYSKRQNMLDINPRALPDYFLVMTGPKTGLTSSRGTTAPLCIESVYLFNARELIPALKSKIGIATSVPAALWEQAEIYPHQNNNALILTEEQKKLIGLFNSLDPSLY